MVTGTLEELEGVPGVSVPFIKKFIVDNPYIPHIPYVKQAWCLCRTNIRELLYGGQAGGGKSDYLLMDGLMYVKHYRCSSLILRVALSDQELDEALIDRSHEWLDDTDAHWNGRHSFWSFPGTRSKLQFGYIANRKDVYRYQSAAFQKVGWEELTQFAELFCYRYMFSRQRSLVGSLIPLTMRSASNPGNEGHEWVKRRFITEGAANGRLYIPANYMENRSINREEYGRSLDELDPITKAQLKRGDWSARHSGGKFKREWFTLIQEEPADLEKVRFWDMAASKKKKRQRRDWLCGLLLGRKGPKSYVLDVIRKQIRPGLTKNLILLTAILDGVETEVWMEQEPGSAGANEIEHYSDLLSGEHNYSFRGLKSTGDKATRANPPSIAAEAGNIYLYSRNRNIPLLKDLELSSDLQDQVDELDLVSGSWISDFLDELEAFPQGSHDDQVDALSGAWQVLGSRGQVAFGVARSMN